MPIYSQNLFVVYPDSLEFDNIFELFEGKRVGMGQLLTYRKNTIQLIFFINMTSPYTILYIFAF